MVNLCLAVFLDGRSLLSRTGALTLGALVPMCPTTSVEVRSDGIPIANRLVEGLALALVSLGHVSNISGPKRLLHRLAKKVPTNAFPPGVENAA